MLADDVGYRHVWIKKPEINKMLPAMQYSGDSEVSSTTVL
jgi:hypothetical protein